MYEEEKWLMIYELKNNNFDLIRQLKRKSFEVKELEHEKMLLERKSKLDSNKLPLSKKNTLSNKGIKQQKNNNKIIFSSLQLLIN